MDITPLTNKINMILGAFAAFMAYLLGDQWILFAAFLGFNFGDFVTRWIAARITGTESSEACSIGIVKKFGYWVMIALSFATSVILIEFGEILGVRLGFLSLFGWFVLGTLTINEIRSILENLVEAYGDKVPRVLVKGLEVANKAFDKAIKIDDETEDSK